MAKTPEYLDEEERAKQYFKIGTFNFKKKTTYIVGGIIIVILIYSRISAMLEADAVERREAAARAALLAGQKDEQDPYVMPDYDELIRQQLHEQYGEPPEGFEWDYSGGLIALSSGDMTAEDVLYTYVRAVSILDFATAQRYSSGSSIARTYQNYFADYSANLADYYSSFLRKQFRFSLTQLEMLGTTDTAVFANGQTVATIKIRCLDLANKDFWLEDRDELFEMMRVYDETESDSLKKEQYIYEYIYSAYEAGKVDKVEKTVEIVMSKDNASGWLVSNDGELENILKYETGVDIANYIFKTYDNWIMNKHLNESLIGTSNNTEDATSSETENATSTESTTNTQESVSDSSSTGTSSNTTTNSTGNTTTTKTTSPQTGGGSNYSNKDDELLNEDTQSKYEDERNEVYRD